MTEDQTLFIVSGMLYVFGTFMMFIVFAPEVTPKNRRRYLVWLFLWPVVAPAWLLWTFSGALTKSVRNAWRDWTIGI